MDKYYQLVLDDYSKPSFTSFPKQYYGTLSQIDELFTAMKRNSRVSEKYHQILSTYDRYLNGETDITHNVAYEEIPFLTPVERIFGIKQLEEIDSRWEHLNTWRCSYMMKCDRADSTHIWVSCQGEYMRCIQTRFMNLRYEDPMGDRVLGCFLLGYPEQITSIELEDSSCQLWNRLFVIEKTFETEIDLRNDYQNFTPDSSDYTEILNDIFGDG